MLQNYQISEQFPSVEEEVALEFPVFARKEYWLLHTDEKELLPITVRNQQNDIIAFWCFCFKGNKLITPFNAPFFSPYVRNLGEAEVIFSAVIKYCKRNYGDPLQFTLNPNLKFLNLKNFAGSLKVLNVVVGSYLKVSREEYSQQIRQKRKRRKLNSVLLSHAFEIEKVAMESWEKVYQQNLIWRRQKGHESFMSEDEMLKAKTRFPQYYHAFQVIKNKELCGTAFFLKVDQNLIYVYSLITDPSTDSEEPSLLLWNAIYEWAQSNGVSVIDMGTSMVPEGNINRSLFRYKQLIGGFNYKKYTFEC